MNLAGLGGRPSVSPTSSRASSPVPRIARRTAEDGSVKHDKYLRRYAAIIERALASWETAPEEWADYIAFLGRLLKAIQSHGQDISTLPHNSAVASRLAQCLNPSLPSGVHQKTLELYAYIFATFGQEHVGSHLPEYLPGLATVLSFASLSVRPAFYQIVERHIVSLPTPTLRPVLKSLVLSLLPALEDETSEDFERAFSIVDHVQHKFTSDSAASDGGFFWQCVFLSIITSPSRRLGAFNYLTRRLPRFQDLVENRGDDTEAPPLPAEIALEPEPGLLIRAFECGLCDTQALIQRGFLDLLVENLPLGSFVLQNRVQSEDLVRLTRATATVLLRKDQNLNRRVFAWFLGPSPKDDASTTQNLDRRGSDSATTSQQSRYFANYGQQPLVRCLLAILSRDQGPPAGKARAFRMLLSLMDRWEIGGALVPELFLPALRSVSAYSRDHTKQETTEVLRSTSLFFDGVESSLIWSELFKLLCTALSTSGSCEDEVLFFLWILQHFSMKEEEMLTLHIPLTVVYLLDWIVGDQCIRGSNENVMNLANALLELLPPRVLAKSNTHPPQADGQEVQQHDTSRDIKAFYEAKTIGNETSLSALIHNELSDVLVHRASSVILKGINSSFKGLSASAQLLLTLLPKLPKGANLLWPALLEGFSERLVTDLDLQLGLQDLTTVVCLLGALSTALADVAAEFLDAVREISPRLLQRIWIFLSPYHYNNHIEAVRLIWQIDEIVKSEATLKATLNGLIRCASVSQQSDVEFHLEPIRCFATLWIHSLPTQPLASRSDAKTAPRRGSSMPLALSQDAWNRRQRVLAGPLYMALDVLSDASHPACNVVCNLLSTNISAGLVLQLLVDRILALSANFEGISQLHRGTEARSNGQRNLELGCAMRHLEGILGAADATVWQALSETNVVTSSGAQPSNSVIFMALLCVQMLGERETPSALSQSASSILSQLLSAPRSIKLTMQTLDLDQILMSKVVASLEWQDAVSQGSLLRLAVMAMEVRYPQTSQAAPITTRRGSSFDQRQKPSMTLRVDTTPQSDQVLPRVPPWLVETLRAGFAHSTYPAHADIWFDFFASSLPFLGDSLLANLLPLTDILCGQIVASLERLKGASATPDAERAFAPDQTLLKLLDCLNLLLAEAHDGSAESGDSEPSRPLADNSQGVLGNMASGILKSQVPQARAPKTNSRLTIILSFMEAVRSCLQVWIWAAHSTNGTSNEHYGSATLTYNATRIRNRTRQMLEQIFNVELLESLEVVMTLWCQTSDAPEGREVLSLLHVMTVSRPQSVVPAILDALCSRTNATSLSPSRQSSLTSDLSASNVVGYLTAYLESVDDDAMDEIWPDCTAFIRDVLSNPLPFRQVLPALLWVTLVLSEKLNNTNFGDHKKMRRGLGDNFQKLLAASFATFSHGTLGDPNSQGRPMAVETTLIAGRHAMDLVVILRHVLVGIDNLLESSDRITTAVNSISNNVIAPAFHAKSFPTTVSADVLVLLAQMARKAPGAKSWKKDLNDAFNRPHFLNSPPDMIEQFWYPVLQQWLLSDRDKIPELLSRLTPPSSAGIMFGVGASAARTKADGETQFTLRRLCILLLAAPPDSSVVHLQAIEAKLAELFESTVSSSPSFAVKAELFIALRALILTVGSSRLSSLWPLINEQLQTALASLTPQDSTIDGFTNLGILQSVKLLDLLVTMAPDEFQVHEWLYITDTTDAVYHPSDWVPAALSDQLAEHLGSGPGQDGGLYTSTATTADAPSSSQRPLLGSSLGYDMEDIKAMSREDFATLVIRPFLSQLSINAYETVYSMGSPSITVYRHHLLEDILDTGTLVDH